MDEEADATLGAIRQLCERLQTQTTALLTTTQGAQGRPIAVAVSEDKDALVPTGGDAEGADSTAQQHPSEVAALLAECCSVLELSARAITALKKKLVESRDDVKTLQKRGVTLLDQLREAKKRAAELEAPKLPSAAPSTGTAVTPTSQTTAVSDNTPQVVVAAESDTRSVATAASGESSTLPGAPAHHNIPRGRAADLIRGRHDDVGVAKAPRARPPPLQLPPSSTQRRTAAHLSKATNACLTSRGALEEITARTKTKVLVTRPGLEGKHDVDSVPRSSASPLASVRSNATFETAYTRNSDQESRTVSQRPHVAVRPLGGAHAVACAAGPDVDVAMQSSIEQTLRWQSRRRSSVPTVREMLMQAPLDAALPLESALPVPAAQPAMLEAHTVRGASQPSISAVNPSMKTTPPPPRTPPFAPSSQSEALPVPLPPPEGPRPTTAVSDAEQTTDFAS